jgi:serine protease inhibitor
MTMFQGTRAGKSDASSYELSSANRLYFRKDEDLKECVTDLFKDEIQKLDFQGNPDQAREDINAWVSGQTKNRITDLLPSGAITPLTNVVLVNAGYFKGLWQSQFQPENTRKSVFYMSASEQTLVDMMRQKGSFNHGKLIKNFNQTFSEEQFHFQPFLKTLVLISLSCLTRATRFPW